MYQLTNTPNLIEYTDPQGNVTFFDTNGTGLIQSAYQAWLNAGNVPIAAKPKPVDPDADLEQMQWPTLLAILNVLLDLNKKGAWSINDATITPANRASLNAIAAHYNIVLL